MKTLTVILLALLIQACASIETDYCSDTENNCTFVLYSEGEDELFVVNQLKASERFTPASTFKIANSLIALETNTLSGTDQLLAVDLDKYPEESWWQPGWATESYDLRGAFQNSVYPIYRSIASAIGQQNMTNYLAVFDYGNLDISSGLDSFWVNGSLEISALEQIEFLQKLYHNEFALKQENLNGLKEIMLVEETDTYKMYAKTGAALVEENNAVLWYVGFIENTTGLHYFAFNMHSAPAPGNAQLRIDLTRDYLQKQGVI
jgi:beta-lactamase class D